MKRFCIVLFAKLIILSALFSSFARAEPTFQVLSELNFRSFLPITGSCEMDYDTSIVSDLPGSRMCMGNFIGSKGQYRISGDTNTDFEIIIRARTPQNGDGFTYTPAGRIVSTVDNVQIVLNTIMTVNTGNGGFIDINLAGQVIVSNVFTPGMNQIISTDQVIAWEQK